MKASVLTLQWTPEESSPQTALGDELQPGTVLCNGQYTIEQYLNSGGFGITYLARDSLERTVVIKECFPSAICRRAGDDVRLRSQSFVQDFDQSVELFQKEARALARLQHPNIVGVHQIFEANSTAYMALDFVRGMDLLELRAKHPRYLKPKVIESLVASLLRALIYVHENGILHRDISPDNILLDSNGTPVLIDFGAARQGASQASRVLSRVHTVKDGYSPQEFYISGSAQSAASDLYALAATVVHLIGGAAPPNSSTRLAAVAENKPDPFAGISGEYPEYDRRFLESVDRCMNLFAKDRLQSAREWLGEIEGHGPGIAVEFDCPPVDPDIEAKVAKMVEDSHRAMAAEQARDVPEVKARDPFEEQEALRLAAQREYWAILNEDPSELAAETGAEDAPEEKPAPIMEAPEEESSEGSIPPARLTQDKETPGQKPRVGSLLGSFLAPGKRRPRGTSMQTETEVP